jgi:hypothetical protein
VYESPYVPLGEATQIIAERLKEGRWPRRASDAWCARRQVERSTRAFEEAMARALHCESLVKADPTPPRLFAAALGRASLAAAVKRLIAAKKKWRQGAGQEERPGNHHESEAQLCRAALDGALAAVGDDAAVPPKDPMMRRSIPPAAFEPGARIGSSSLLTASGRVFLNVRLRSSDIDRLSPLGDAAVTPAAGDARANAADWLQKQAEAEVPRRLKKRDAINRCVNRGMTWREAEATYQTLPLHLRYMVGKKGAYKASK